MPHVGIPRAVSLERTQLILSELKLGKTPQQIAHEQSWPLSTVRSCKNRLARRGLLQSTIKSSPVEKLARIEGIPSVIAEQVTVCKCPKCACRFQVVIP